jgi:hypothetical protein
MRDEYFIEGTEPQQGQAPQPGGGGILSRLFHSGNSPAAPGPVTTTAPGNDNTIVAAPNPDASQPPAEKKGGVLKRFLSIFKGKSSQPVNPPEAQKKPAPEG